MREPITVVSSHYVHGDLLQEPPRKRIPMPFSSNPASYTDEQVRSQVAKNVTIPAPKATKRREPFNVSTGGQGRVSDPQQMGELRPRGRGWQLKVTEPGNGRGPTPDAQSPAALSLPPPRFVLAGA